MEMDELESCCSVQVLSKLSGDHTTAKGIKNKMVTAILDYDNGHGSIDKEYPRFFMATTKKEQWQAANALKEVGFKAKKFYGRHQSDYKRQTKYMTLWTLDRVPTDVMREARAIALANNGGKRTKQSTNRGWNW